MKILQYQILVSNLEAKITELEAKLAEREWVSVACLQCLTVFKKKPAEIKRHPNHFCSKKCTGQYRIIQNNKTLFDKCVRTDSGCWEWSGATNKDGYGVTRYDGVSQLAHRAAYIWLNGSIPNDMCVCHNCDNPKCINPAHLFIGTQQDNMDDMAKKGRRYKKSLPPTMDK
ncbi:HNH endonuclease [Candidatus Pacearchaeota archaeon]|nr:HNH endonuclease [Candidatus Pacearchaeota archaeon]